MSKSALPLLLLGGAALLLMGSKKSAPKPVATPTDLPDMVAPPTKGKAGSSTWKKRQQALVDAGYDVGPHGIDGKPGPDTRAAIRAFQSDANIQVDGLWGAQTAAAMAEALKMASEGLGRSYYEQIGAMLQKFKDAFFDIVGSKEEGAVIDFETVKTKEELAAEKQDASEKLASLGYPEWPGLQGNNVKAFQSDINKWRSAWSNKSNIDQFFNYFGELPQLVSIVKSIPMLSVNGQLNELTKSAIYDAVFVEEVVRDRVGKDKDWMDFISFVKSQS